MFTRKPLSVAVQRALSGVAIAATAASIPAVAQAAQQLEEIVVTGSRIPTTNAITSSPVSTISAQDVKVHGFTRIEDLLNTQPQIYASDMSGQSNGATGTATVDLRGLGPDRTLTLVNGHRLGMGDIFEVAPDINQIPADLIQRVEVLTGGASATYGSDAVAGVVNFIMKNDFQGAQFSYQYSANWHDNSNNAVQQIVKNSNFQGAPSSDWDGATDNFNLTVGANSADGKGNVEAYVGYRHIDPVLQQSRDFSVCALSPTQSAPTPANAQCFGSATNPNGLFAPFDGVNYFTVVNDHTFSNWLTAGPNGGPLYYNYNPLNHFQRPDVRYTAGLFGHYDLNDHFKPYVEFQFMDDHSLAQIAPSGDFFVTNKLNCDNPLLSAQQKATLDANVGCGSDGFYPLYIGRRNVEGGPRFDDLRHTDYRVLVGLKGDITPDWTYDAYANFNRTIRTEVYQNDLSITRIKRALDVVTDPSTGQPVCQSALNGVDPNCVPWNIFQVGGVTQAAVNYLKLPLFNDDTLEEDQYVAFINGDLTSMGLVSPYAKDGVKIVLGGEYRDDRIHEQPDQGFTSGDGAGQGGPIAATNGTLAVKEFFTEVKVPLVQDRPWIQSLSVDGAYRYSSYSSKVTSNTYKGSGQWTPVTGFKLRGGFSHAVRAANIVELFAPQNIGLWAGVDPCAGSTPQQTAAQCANSGVTAAQYGHVPKNPAQQYNGLFGGNTALQPEKANTFTVGGVFQPPQIPNLLFSIDYWDITVKKAISTVAPQFIVTQCGLTGNPAFCSLVHRSPGNGNLWLPVPSGGGFVTSTNVNIGFFETAGIDFNGSYSYDLGNYGTSHFHFVGTWLQKWNQQNTPTSSIIHCQGLWGGAGNCGTGADAPVYPDWKHTFTATWVTPWNLTFTGTWRYIAGVKEEPGGIGFNVPAFNYGDLSAVYTPTWIPYGNTKITVGVNNVSDNDPPVNGEFANIGVFGNANTLPGVWDTLGRFVFMGVTYSF